MKKLILTFFVAALVITACNRTDKAEKARQDSIAAAAAADSMLNSATEADTMHMNMDTVAVDSIK